MKRLASIYPEAVEHTKQKVRDDISFFLQDKERRYLPLTSMLTRETLY